MFVYGTLRVGGANAGLIDVFEHRREPAVLADAGLWLWQRLPFALEADGEVRGELVTTPELEELLVVLDQLEGVDRESSGEDGWYRRRLKVVKVLEAEVMAETTEETPMEEAEGFRRSVMAWTYFGNPAIEAVGTRVPSGDFDAIARKPH